MFSLPLESDTNAKIHLMNVRNSVAGDQNSAMLRVTACIFIAFISCYVKGQGGKLTTFLDCVHTSLSGSVTVVYFFLFILLHTRSFSLET